MITALLQAWAIAAAGLSSLGSALIVIMLLNRKAGPGSGFGFGLGYFASTAVICMAAAFYGQAGLGDAQSDSPSLAITLLTLAFGVLISVVTIKTWRSAPSNEPPAFLAKLDELHPPKALAIGLFIPLINVKNMAIFLPAVAVLVAAELEPLQLALAVLSTAVVFCGGLLSPLLIYVVLPRRSERWLGAMRGWIERNSHKVARVVLPLIALLLLSKAARGLWALFG